MRATSDKPRSLMLRGFLFSIPQKILNTLILCRIDLLVVFLILNVEL